MLKEDYKIDITGRQFYEESADTGPGEITLRTTGTYTERGGARFIAYKEYDEDDPKVSYTSVLKIEPGRVTMMRAGSATRLILEQGRRHLCLYDTGYGTLSVGVFTSELRSSLGKRGGKLNVKYTLDIDSNLSSRNEIQIKVEPYSGLAQ
ncbi:DUF1934 domain-containing protein [Neglectibacter caecimuris]|uniref:DUF1934 domain-containing protein n=1 Tax=Neglectibacter caecimuris TaxID=3093658 RepID=UPI002AC8A4AE|nr:DUF1934 domain-containing protein [Neglectibacter sp. M00184]